MRQLLRAKQAARAVIALSICAVVMAACNSADQGVEKTPMRDLVPDELPGWHVADSVETYDRETIFDYMNGAGEIYLSYGFRELVALRMSREGHPDILVELFDMGTSEDAYGVFSQLGQGEEAGIGQGSDYRKGLLCFWKSSYFVCLQTPSETPLTKRALLGLGRAIDGRITAIGSKPRLLLCLPDDGLVKESIRYFHIHASLNYHYYLADQNILNLGRHTEAVLARYGSERSYLLCVRYPDTSQAAEAFRSFVDAYVPEAKESGIAQIDNEKWVAVRQQGEIIMIVFDGPTMAFAQDLAEAAANRLDISGSTVEKDQ